MQRSPTCENCQRTYELREYRPVGRGIPLILPCGHTFCEGCLVKVAKLKPEISCFSCEALVSLDPPGEKGVKNLVPNIYLLGLLLYNRRVALESSEHSLGGPVSAFNGIGYVLRNKKPVEQLPMSPEKTDNDNVETKKQDNVLCDECSSKSATCQCKSCDCKFCDGCFQQVHRTSKSLAKHVSLPLEYPSEEELCCAIHPNRNLEFFDNDLKEYVCALCVISERCKQHDIVPVSEMKEESNEELENVVNKAKQLLRWFDYSNKILTNALPDEAQEANQLFSDIHEHFSTCHTLLLKRQMKLMTEASQKLLDDSSTNDLLQELSEKIRNLTSTIKDYEMVSTDKRVLKMKSSELVERLNNITDSPCIVERNMEEVDNNINFKMADSIVTDIESYGSIEKRTSKKFYMKSIEDIPEDERENLLLQNSTDEKETSIINVNEIVDDNIPLHIKKPTKLSLLSGHYERVYVTHSNNPTDFKVQRCADKDRLQVMMEALNKHCRHANKPADQIHTVQEGQFVCAQFLADNHWYRARISCKSDPKRPDVIPTWSNGLCVEVLYVDYGNSERLPLNRLRRLKETFLDVPEMAVSCSLTDIVPPNKELVWSERSIRAFNSLTGDRPLLMNIRKRIGGKLYVDLRKPDDDDAANDDRPISVRDTMVFLEVAVFFSPASHPNADTHRPSSSFTNPDSLEKHTFIDVTVTHVEHPHSIYVQRLDSIITEEQKHLSQLYTGKNKRVWKIDWPYRNLVCAAKFSGDKSWYRAVIKNVNLNDTVDVLYVDYGNSETIPFTDVKHMPPMYLELPIQCWEVKLHHVDFVDDTEEWSEKCKNELEELLLNNSYVLAVKETSVDSLASVELFDTSTEEDVSINKLVVQNGWAKRTGNCSEPATVKKTFRNSTDTPSTNGFPSYLPAVYPTNKCFRAAGVHVSEDATIYLHVMQGGESSLYLDDSLRRIMCDLKDLSPTFKPPKTTENVYIGQACVGQFPVDDLWYRVKILSINSHKSVKVEFIDFGNSEDIPIKRLHLQPMHIDIPSQCVAVKLADVELKADVDIKSFVEVLDALTIGKKLNVETVLLDEKSEIPKVKLWDDSNTPFTDLLSSNDYVIIKNAEVSTNEISSSDDVISVQPIHESPHSWYTRQRLPPVGTRFDVHVTQVNQPDLVFIQRNPADETEELLVDDSDDDTARVAYEEFEQLFQISDVINTDEYLTNESLKLPQPIEGMACIGKYFEDGMYYRAKIDAIIKDETGGGEDMVDLVFVDYGNSERVPISSLKAIWADFVNLPMQSTQVKIAGVTMKDGQTEWLLDERKQFFLMVANKRMIAQVVEKGTSQDVDVKNQEKGTSKDVDVKNQDDSVDTPVIHLYDRCLNENEETGETVDVLIGELLRDNNIADFQLTEKEKKLAF